MHSSELGTTTPKPEPHQLQIAWAETCQTYPKVFNNLVVFGLVDSCGLAGVSPLAKLRSTSLDKCCLRTGISWAPCLQVQFLDFQSHSSVKIGQSDIPNTRRVQCILQVLLVVFGAPGPRRAGESCRPRRCRWLVAGAVSAGGVS